MSVTVTNYAAAAKYHSTYGQRRRVLKLKDGQRPLPSPTTEMPKLARSLFSSLPNEIGIYRQLEVRQALHPVNPFERKELNLGLGVSVRRGAP